MNELNDKLTRLIEKSGQKLLERQYKNLLTYASLVTEYGQNVNLVSKKSLPDFIEDQIGDALSLVPVIIKQYPKNQSLIGLNLIDVGTGAGLPGLVLAILFENLKVSLLDSNLKKINFLNLAIANLEWSNTPNTILGRAEELAHQPKYREHFDFATARALSSVKVALELTTPYLKPRGLFLIQKTSTKLESELKESANLLKLLNCEQIGILEAYPNSHVKEHKILIVEKQKATAKEYPRKWTNIIN